MAGLQRDPAGALQHAASKLKMSSIRPEWMGDKISDIFSLMDDLAATTSRGLLDLEVHTQKVLGAEAPGKQLQPQALGGVFLCVKRYMPRNAYSRCARGCGQAAQHPREAIQDGAAGNTKGSNGRRNTT